MRSVGQLAGVAAGIAAGVVGTLLYLGQPRPAGAASNDRYQDSIMATGAVSVNPRIQTDVIDRTQGKIVGWSEVDLRNEFGVVAQQDVHFMMTTGYVTQGQSALYLAETSTGQLGVYTMGPGQGGSGIVIRRHDMTRFRQPAPGAAVPAAGAAPNGGLPVVPPPDAKP